MTRGEQPVPRASPAFWLAASALAAAGALVTFFWGQGTVASAVLAAVLVLVTSSVALLVLEDRRAALAAGSVPAAWGLVHDADLLVLAVALPFVLALAWLPEERAAQALVAAAASALGAWVLLPSPLAIVVAALLAAGACWLRPRRPTVGLTKGLRAFGLFLPALLLALAFGMEIATGRIGGAGVREDLEIGLGLLGLGGLLGLSLLGLSTLLESEDPLQGRAWAGGAGALGIVVASVLERDPSLSLALLACAAGPVALLAAIAVARARNMLKVWVWLLPGVLALVQFHM